LAGDGPPNRDDRLDRIIAEYLDALGKGHAPSARDLLDRHPDLAVELAEFLANYEDFQFIRGGGRSPEDVSLDAGERVGDYRILEELGRGGMGVVFKARQLSLDRVVALKLILAGQLATEEEVERFRREAEAAAQLDHPHIVKIHEIGRHEMLDYFSMQYIEGGRCPPSCPQRPRLHPANRPAPRGSSS